MILKFGLNVEDIDNKRHAVFCFCQNIMAVYLYIMKDRVIIMNFYYKTYIGMYILTTEYILTLPMA